MLAGFGLWYSRSLPEALESLIATADVNPARLCLDAA